MYGLGSQAATVRASTKNTISNDTTSSQKFAALKDKVQALTNELRQNNLEQESIKQKVNQWDGCFKSLCFIKIWEVFYLKVTDDGIGNEGEDDSNNEMGEDYMNDDFFYD